MVSQHSRNRALIQTVDEWVAADLTRRDFVRRMSALGGGAVFGGALANHLLSRDAAASPRGVALFQDDPPAAPGGTVVAATIDSR
ncbi:MAG: twin-arginine translocation signal domain-containing protein [Chloroflexota bacterium]|nr:twin-arginine translocation signal domain-containing protein [Chloroflexota bacterium]